MAEYFSIGTQYLDLIEMVQVSVQSKGVWTPAIATPGYVHAWLSAYKNDNSYPMWCYYTTKDVDFTDLYPDLIDTFKTIKAVRVFYEDLDADTPINVYISNDGGVTWDYQSETLGNGDGAAKSQEFYFMGSTMVTGKKFRVRVECLSTTKRMKILGIEIDFISRGESFNVSSD